MRQLTCARAADDEFVSPALVGYDAAVATLTIKLPARQDQTAFNLRRWAEILEDDELPKISGRVETDRHGYLMVSPPAAPWHSSFQLEIGRRLAEILPDGRAMTECAISTADGVRAADVTWLSRERSGEIEENACLASAPEICIEIVSPSNTAFEMREKRALYFAAGAHEVWFCDREGKMTFFINANSTGESTSRFCPEFPTHIKLS